MISWFASMSNDDISRNLPWHLYSCKLDKCFEVSSCISPDNMWHYAHLRSSVSVKMCPLLVELLVNPLSCWGLIHHCVGDLLKLGHHREYQLHKSGGWQFTCFIVVNSDRLSISWQVLQIEAALRAPDVGREDLAHILQAVQVQEKQNLRMVGQPRNHTLGLNVYI